MSLTINAKTYTADSFQKDQVGYIGSLKTVTIKDDVVLYRKAPKASAVYSGAGRTTAKLTRTLALSGSLTPSGDCVVQIDVMVPVGYTAADVDAMLNDFGAFLSSASFKSHVKTQAISF